MRILKRFFDFYLQASIHVALAVYALVKMTHHQFGITGDDSTAYFAFFGTIVGYNFVKYDALARVRKGGIGIKIRSIAAFSLVCFLAAVYFFFQLRFLTQAITAGLALVTMLYTLPFFPNRRNARNWAGFKIYIVAFCWVGVTLFLPLLNADVPFTDDFYFKCVQRFILIFVLILVFEIIDLAKDDPHLQTVPQQIGVKRTKILGIILMLVFYGLEFLLTDVQNSQLIINSFLVLLLWALLAFANQHRSKYYSSFWTEIIPVLWWLLMLLFSHCF